jgi:hypothetical protein
VQDRERTSSVNSIAPPDLEITTTLTMSLTDQLKVWGGNLTRNTSAAFAELRLKDYIRMVTIIGAYCLLRPYIIALGGKLQTKVHERDSAEGQEDGAEISANELRGKFAIPGVDESDGDDDEEGEARAGDWGRKARVRQRRFIRAKLEAEEKRLQEEAEAESDKELEEFLIG